MSAAQHNFSNETNREHLRDAIGSDERGDAVELLEAAVAATNAGSVRVRSILRNQHLRRRRQRRRACWTICGRSSRMACLQRILLFECRPDN